MSGGPRDILYDRVSTVMQAQGGYSGGKDGYQLDTCRAFSERTGGVVVDTITDVDSGAEWNIAGLIEAVERAERGEYDRLIVYETSRFARDSAKKVVYERQLSKRGVRVVYLNVPEGDGPEARLLSTMLGALDEMERERIRKRVMDGIRQKARGGDVVGAGVAPYGYRFVTTWSAAKHKDVPVGLEPHPQQAPVLVGVFDDAAVVPLAEIARRLTDAGVPTPTGRSPRWTPSALSVILANRAYLGEWSYAGIVVTVPPLVAPAAWDGARRGLGDRRATRRGRRPEADDPYLLRGMLRCGHCGGPLSTDHASSWGADAEGRRAKTRVYRCLRHKAARAARAGAERCVLPSLVAAVDGDPFEMHRRLGIEDVARHAVERDMLPPSKLNALLARAEEIHGGARRAHEERLAELDAEIARHERRRDRAVEEQLDAERGSARYALLRESEQREEALVGRLRRDRAALALAVVPGVGVDDVKRLRAIAERYVGRFDTADPSERRRIYRDLRLRGTVTLDPEGEVRLGGRRFSVCWEAMMAVGDSDKLTSANWILSLAAGTPLALVPATHAAGTARAS